MHQFRLLKRLLPGALAAALVLMPARAFTDTEDHWAKESIDKWSQEYGVLNGYEDGTFRPDDSITRGAFAGILDRFLRFQSISAPETFTDTPGTYWESSILKLNAAGVYLGNDGKALPGDTITRQQAVSMVARAFRVDAESVSLFFEDQADIAEYARPYISEMSSRGYLSEAPDGAFRPTDPLTRAELVDILNNMIAVLVQETGTYSSDITGSVLINAPEGATVENMTVSGDLLLAPGVTGNVVLKDVKIDGHIRNFSPISPEIVDTSIPEEPEKPEDEPFDWGIVVVPVTPSAPENPSDPGTSEDPNQPTYPGIQPSEVYTPGIPTSQYIEYDGKRIPVYEGTEPGRLYPGDFAWEEDRLVYTGSEFRTRFGIDVSAYQNRASENETIDWQAVADDGVEFAFVRVGLRGYTTGNIVEDAFYRQNIQGAMDAGIETGVYFFAQAITVEEAIEEADFVIERLRDLEIDGPVVYDWEMGTKQYRVYGLAPEMATACAIAFCQRVEEAGYTPMIYEGKYVGYMKYDQGAIAPYMHWYPEYKNAESEKLYPTFHYQMDYWQFTDSCSIDGIGGPVDASLQFIRR